MALYAVWLSPLQPRPIRVDAEEEEEAVRKACAKVFREYPGFFIEAQNAKDGAFRVDKYWSLRDPNFPRIVGAT